MSHTPGPWYRNIKPADKYVTVWSGRNTHVAYVATKGLSSDEIEANIQLIAAAPDLLEVLERYADMDWDQNDELAQLCRDAIAKAKGGA